MSGDIESIGNHIIWIAELATQKDEGKIKFTEIGMKELQEIITLVNHNLDDAVSLVEAPHNEKISGLIRREEEIDVKVKERGINTSKDFITVFAPLRRELYLSRYSSIWNAFPTIVQILPNMFQILRKKNLPHLD